MYAKVLPKPLHLSSVYRGKLCTSGLNHARAYLSLVQKDEFVVKTESIRIIILSNFFVHSGIFVH